MNHYEKAHKYQLEIQIDNLTNFPPEEIKTFQETYEFQAFPTIPSSTISTFDIGGIIYTSQSFPEHIIDGRPAPHYKVEIQDEADNLVLIHFWSDPDPELENW